MDTGKQQKVLDQFVKDEDGKIFQVVGDQLNHNKVQLRYRNRYSTLRLSEFKKRQWRRITIEEYNDWIKQDKEFMDVLNRKIVKRILLAQLLIEVDEDLQEDFTGEQYFVSKLKKSVSESIRVFGKNFDNLYEANPTLVTNIINNLENLVNTCSGLELDDYMYINKMITDYKLDPKGHKEKIEISLKQLDN